MAWFYRQPEIPGDVPIPSQLFRVEPGNLETLLISEKNDHVIRISSDHYDFRNDLAEFQCHAYDGEKLLAMETAYIHRTCDGTQWGSIFFTVALTPVLIPLGVKERIRVQVFDENSRTAVYALEDAKTTLSCYVEGRFRVSETAELFEQVR